MGFGVLVCCSPTADEAAPPKQKKSRPNLIGRPPPSANPVSRVLYPAEAGPLSFIYDCGHPQPPATYPSTSDEQPLAVDIHGLATRKAYSRTTLLPPRWALTPPFHPYLPIIPIANRPTGGHSLLRFYTLTDVESLARAALCVARTFLPPPRRAAIERICLWLVVASAASRARPDRHPRGGYFATGFISFMRNCVVTVPR